jgi:hypothetical protein
MAAALQKIAEKAVVQKLNRKWKTARRTSTASWMTKAACVKNKALRGSAKKRSWRYTKQLDDQETQLAALRKKIQDTEIQRDAAQTQLETMIDELHLEASF